jgi:small GTP-binding protein
MSIIYKCVLAGPQGCGKTSLVNTFKHKQFNDLSNTTIGAEYTNIRIDSERSVNLWDTAGCEKYSSIMPLYYRETDLVILVFDISETQHMNKLLVNNWVMNIQKYTNNILIIWNKIDLLQSNGSSNSGKDVSINHNYLKQICSSCDGVCNNFEVNDYFVSAKDYDLVRNLFENLLPYHLPSLSEMTLNNSKLNHSINLIENNTKVKNKCYFC